MGKKAYLCSKLTIKDNTMARKNRILSSIGIYHVMIRGINRQLIFDDDSDYRKFLMIMSDMIYPKSELGQLLPPYCAFYAYCLMPNHVHLLVHEKSERLPSIMKQIAQRYAKYYNSKYEHFGHVFQDRYKSEPVNTSAYFLTLLRYIHQNPVASALCKDVESYEWSSWHEFTGDPRQNSNLCAVRPVLKSFPLEDLREQVYTPLQKALRVLDYDMPRTELTDEAIEEFLMSNYGLDHPTDLQKFAKKERDAILKATKDFGGSIRQIARITSLGFSIVKNAK